MKSSIPIRVLKENRCSPTATCIWSTDLLVKIGLGVISKYPENTVMPLGSCNDERSGPLFVYGVDLCSVINQ